MHFRLFHFLFLRGCLYSLSYQAPRRVRALQDTFFARLQGGPQPGKKMTRRLSLFFKNHEKSGDNFRKEILGKRHGETLAFITHVFVAMTIPGTAIICFDSETFERRRNRSHEAIHFHKAKCFTLCKHESSLEREGCEGVGRMWEKTFSSLGRFQTSSRYQWEDVRRDGHIS